MKKYTVLSFILMIILCFSACVGGGESSSDLSEGASTGSSSSSQESSEGISTESSSSSQESNEKILDMYVILGQSNALGISNMSLLDTENKDTLDSNRADNIYFYGGGELNEHKAEKTKLGFGQGNNTVRFGAEIGLADYLSQNGLTENDTLIFKCAYGGTTLTDIPTGNSNKRWGGTWTPPSIDEIPAADRAGYPCTYTVSGVEHTGTYAVGAIYNKAVSWLNSAVDMYETDGYTIRLKGTFWMQGETDAQNSVQEKIYERYLKALISDLRLEYSELSLLDAETAPFVIGKIAPTFNWDNTTTRAGVQVVRAVQDKVALETPYVLTVETEDYIIVDPATSTFASGCHDKSHFGADDMVNLGRDVGEACFKPNAQVTVVGNGSYVHKIQDGYDIFTLAPSENASIFEVLVDGEDMVIDVLLNGNSFRVPRNAAHTVKITFVEN